jgi:hypothetical protein
MLMLSIRIRNLCTHSVHASVIYACTELTRKELMRALSVPISFTIFQMFILGTLRIRIRNFSVH